MSGHESTLRASLSVLRDRAQAEYPGDPASRDRWFWCAAGALLAGAKHCGCCTHPHDLEPGGHHITDRERLHGPH